MERHAPFIYLRGDKKVFQLEGIRILDSAHQYPGPYCSMLLADLGAEVVKVERPGVGDLARYAPDFFRSINRNKKSLTLNLKVTHAREILYRMVEHCDVFTEGFRPGVVKRLGIDYETLKNINPRLIYCSISGYGQDGPYRDLPGHDLNYQAMSGMLQCFKDKEGNLVQPGLAIGDLSSAMFAAVGILAALMGRERNGEGRYIDVSMFDGLISWMSTYFGIFFGTGSLERTHDAGYGIFCAGDGQEFTLGIAHEDWFWDRLCAAIGLDAFHGVKGPERRSRRKEIQESLQTIFSDKPIKEWIRILQEADVPVAPVNSMKDLVKDQHVAAREMVQEMLSPSGEINKQISFPIKLSNMSRKMRMPTPELGEHTESILKGIGYSNEDIQRFKEENAI
ncbi:MAG: CoA transferase [Deltaproteobacteria bacterium]|nr:CoA transferase [Deltaproteobacteria bacterium]